MQSAVTASSTPTVQALPSSETVHAPDSDGLTPRDRALLDDELDASGYDKIDYWYKEDYDAVAKSAKGQVVDLTVDDDKPDSFEVSDDSVKTHVQDLELAKEGAEQDVDGANQAIHDHEGAPTDGSSEASTTNATSPAEGATPKKKRASKPDPCLPSKWGWFIQDKEGAVITNARLKQVRSATHACFENFLRRPDLIVPSVRNPTGAYVFTHIPLRELRLIIAFLYRRYPELRSVQTPLTSVGY